MDLRQVESFVRVTEASSFTRAARALGLTQPAVTRQVAALEAELGVKLFDRLGREIRLTAAGRAFYPFACRVLDALTDGRTAVRDVALGASGALAVGAANTLAAYVLPPLLSEFRRTYPGVDLSVATGMSAAVVEMTARNQTDLGLISAEVVPTGLRCVQLCPYDTVLVTPPGHPLAEEETVQVDQLRQATLVLMKPGSQLRTHVDRLLQDAGIPVTDAMELDNIEVIKRLVESGLGVSLVPAVTVREEAQAGRLVALPLHDFPALRRHLYLIYRPDRYHSAAMLAFSELLRRRLGEEEDPIPTEPADR